jgi:shikimate dehydrogenase
VVARSPDRAEPAVRCGSKLGLPVSLESWSAGFDALVADAAVVVNTVPVAAVEPHVGALALAPCVLDVIYHPWPTALATAVAAHGGRLATGLDMLLHQAFGQVEQFTGRPAPRQAMRDALVEKTGGQVPLPL